MRDVFITGAARTPMGGFQGDLAPVNAAELGGEGLAHFRLGRTVARRLAALEMKEDGRGRAAQR